MVSDTDVMLLHGALIAVDKLRLMHRLNKQCWDSFFGILEIIRSAL